MEIKYLSDGRKVAVIGSLNQQESIVQEIFVTGSGDEIPSGERFVTKSLHSEPVKPWKQKEAEKAEVAFQKAKDDLKNLELDIRRLKGEKTAHSELVKNNLKVIAETSKLSDFDLDLISCVMTGNIKWIVSDYCWWAPEPFDSQTFKYEGSYDYRSCEFEGIKMISMLGVSKGKYRFEISSWADGSGSAKGCKFFKDDLQLKEWLLKKIDESESHLNLEQVKRLSSFVDVPVGIKEKAKVDFISRIDLQKEDAIKNANIMHLKNMEQLNGY